jgi:hypothetical protein
MTIASIWRTISANILVLATLASPASAMQTRPAERGALIGGLIGGTGSALLGALIGHGICDAADCSDAWFEGAVPGLVIGGVGGALVGGAIGALVPSPGSGNGSSGSAGAARGPVRVGLTAGLSVGLARLESDLIDHSVASVALSAGVRRRGFTIGPEFGLLDGTRWRVTTQLLNAMLAPTTGSVRPFAELGFGRFQWRHPGVVVDACPIPDDPFGCTYKMGTVRDAYFGGILGVGVAIGSPSRAWGLIARARYHNSGGRNPGDGSSVSRQIRQVDIGARIRIR